MPTQTADAIRQLRRAAAMRALYPDGHPIHASALASAREAVEGLLDGNERVDLVFAGGEISRDGQTLPDSDGAVSELAGRWWAQGICGLRIGREASEGELSLLLDMSAPSARDLDVNVLNERLRQLDARHLAIIEIDYERFVPRSRLPQELREELGGSDLGRVLRELVATPPDPGQGLSDSQRRSLAVLLDHPQALADAMEMGVLTPEEGSNPVPGPPVASVDPAERMLPQQGVPVDLAGARLATTVRHLARLGGELEAGAPSVVSAKLAAAVRHLDPAVVAHAYRAVGEEARGEPDALAEVANCLTVPELVQIVRSKPGAVAAEPSAVYRRLLTRVSGGGERAGELAPALREALTEDGWSDHLYASTIGVVLEEIAGRHSEVEEFPDGAIPIALRRAPEEARRARREEIQPQLERAFGDRVWADRALVSLELLQAAATPHAQSVAAADLKLSIQQTPAALKQEVWAQVALDLADLVDPHGPATEDHKSVARTVIAETSDPALIDLLRDFYPRASPEDRRRTARVLTVCGGHGLAAVVRLLLEDRGLLAEDDVEPLVQALLDADEAGLGGARSYRTR